MRHHIQRHFDDMTRLLKLWVRSCELCKQLESRTSYIPGLYEPLALNSSTTPFETVMVDLLGPVTPSMPGC